MLKEALAWQPEPSLDDAGLCLLFEDSRLSVTWTDDPRFPARALVGSEDIESRWITPRSHPETWKAVFGATEPA